MTQKILPFKEQIASLPIADLEKIKHAILHSPNLTCINSLSKQLLIATINHEIHLRKTEEHKLRQDCRGAK